jgi:hypothetical protein
MSEWFGINVADLVFYPSQTSEAASICKISIKYNLFLNLGAV